MKKIKKILLITLALISSLSINNICTFAKTSIKNDSIPSYMLPNTIIIYNEDLSYDVIQGGDNKEKKPLLSINTVKTSNFKMSSEELEQYNYENAQIEEAKKAIEEGSANVIYEEMPAPEPGLKVTYGSDGLLLNIYYPDPSKATGYSSYDPDLLKNNAETMSARTITTIATWGINFQNILTYDSIDDSVTGTGRFTSFDDKMGNHNNYLKVGDCATKLAYDNIASGTKVKARNLDTNQVATYTKNDVGGMPDAVLDIWGAGIDWIGGKYSTGKNVNNGRMYHKTRA